MSINVSENLLDAIQILTQSAIGQAGYDKTIQAQILSCEDKTIGKYKCRYQDAIFYAYSNNSNMTFTDGSYVYILVPGNDMTKEKTILGTTDKLGVNYISQAEGEQVYDILGNNGIVTDEKFFLNSNNKVYLYSIYDYTDLSHSDISINENALNQYIKQSSSLIVAATFKTEIPRERQYRGHYGIAFNLAFHDNALNQEVVRTYIIDEDNMIDNPYKLNYPVRQYQIFDIDGENFIRINSIQIFNKDFPQATGNTSSGKLTEGDIIISRLEVLGANRMSEKEINGVGISFYTPHGAFFTQNSTDQTQLIITAQVKVKGKLVSSSQNIEFYWGSENVGISTNSEYYNRYLGRGWKCLNEQNVVKEQNPQTSETEPKIEWVPGSDTLIIKRKQAKAKNSKFKVAILYDNIVVTKTIDIQNLSNSAPNITIESSDGDTFYNDIGHPTLTCKINDIEELNNFKYYWAYESNAGILEELSETTDLNEQYQEAVYELNSLYHDISIGVKFENAEADNLTEAEKAVKAFDAIQRVNGNKIFDTQIKNITNFGTFKCSVYDQNDIYLGTASLKITNSLKTEGTYSIVINNGDAVFQYNEKGMAPNSKSLNIQQPFEALSFTVYDNLGNPIDEDVIMKTNYCSFKWGIPIKDTLLKDIPDKNGNSSGSDDEYIYYDNNINLFYNIAELYNIKKQRNQIKLIVDYKDISLTAQTNFTFVKQGEPGTNGTQYIVKLVPNVQNNYNTPLWPMVTTVGSDMHLLNYALPNQSRTDRNESIINVNSSYQFFKVQLWKNGELIWEGNRSDNTVSNVKWEILKNKYSSHESDASAFSVSNSFLGTIQYLGNHLDDLNTPLANIVKCSLTWQGKTYYGTIPIITAWVKDANYRVELKDYTGFRYVTYTADGMMPQYDSSNPFEITCLQKIDDIWEDISNINDPEPESSQESEPSPYKVTYTFSSCGDTKNIINGQVVSNDANLLTKLDNSSLLSSQCEYSPISRYDGACVNEAVICSCEQDEIIGKINIPVHFLLNKYGFAHLNAWDGNSIQINEEDGYILAPQMGAGIKENNNTFTGVVMGEVKDPAKTESDIGLFGYGSGDRTFFLDSKTGNAYFKGEIHATSGSLNSSLTIGNTPTTLNKIKIDSENALIEAEDARKYADNYLDFNPLTGLTIGALKENLSGEVNIQSDGVRIYNEKGVEGTYIYSGGMSIYGNSEDEDEKFEIAHFGYGKTNITETGATITVGQQPYVTLGVRDDTQELYDESKTYSLYSLCLHENEGKIEKYICIKEITAAEQWNENHWQLLYGGYSVAEGIVNIASGPASHAEGYGTYAIGVASHAEGLASHAEGMGAHAEGFASYAKGQSSHAEGMNSHAEGWNSHAEGNGTYAIGWDSHAEGYDTHAEGNYSHAEGYNTHAEGYYSHAEGEDTHAEGNYSHAEGEDTHAEGLASHAEGSGAYAIGNYSHAEGYNTHAERTASHAGGSGTYAIGNNQTVIGRYNYFDKDNRNQYVFIIGKGSGTENRSNALEVDWDGNLTIAGNLTQGSDKRLKEHKEYLSENNKAINFINNLKPVYYIKDKENHLGFYAQDVEQIDSWKCMIGEMNGYKTLGYIQIIAPLVAYCQNLEQKINKLENILNIKQEKKGDI